ncbi:hypothetical protein FOA52_001948 [Chlamydomonas sp. UWO 241]|nr:hypothetical protein FOA52_001948 [Chlamydomonas sp. UWO 241]
MASSTWQHNTGESAIWDQRYGTPDAFAYGREPNVHVKEAAAQFLPSSPPLLIYDLASGEGRNAWYLASLGHTVHAIDFSAAGLAKGKGLAQAAGCGERYVSVKADINKGEQWLPPSAVGTVDALVMSFCHLAKQDKAPVLENIVKALKPGGLLILECFHPDQIAKGYRAKSGGPPDPTMMYTLAELRGLLPAGGGTEVEAAELEYELKEGSLHAGVGAVVRLVWRKAGVCTK